MGVASVMEMVLAHSEAKWQLRCCSEAGRQRSLTEIVVDGSAAGWYMCFMVVGAG
jgi:hypothetical protein